MWKPQHDSAPGVFVVKNVGGRPRDGADVKAAPLSIRTEPALRQALDEAAARNKRSLTKEIEARLRQSFNSPAEATLPPALMEKVEAAARANDVTPDEEISLRVRHTFLADGSLGSPETARLLRLIGSAIDFIERRTAKPWHSDVLTFESVQRAINNLLHEYGIGWDVDLRSPELIEVETQYFEAQVAVRRAERARLGFLAQHDEFESWYNTRHAYEEGLAAEADVEEARKKIPDALWETYAQMLDDIAGLSAAALALRERRRELMRPNQERATKARRYGELGAMASTSRINEDAIDEIWNLPFSDPSASDLGDKG